jgi:N-acetylglucosamine malate deacetylase 1
MRNKISSLSHTLNTTQRPQPEDVAGSPPENVLVLAPHPDDEIIGCGGTMIKHVQKGSRLLVVYLTDGREGRQGGGQTERPNVRKDEARAGLHIIGISGSIFLDYPDRQLSEHLDECAQSLAKIIDDFKPDSIFVPNFWDVHIDHAATAKILAKTLKTGGRESTCYSYEVWTAIIPNTIIDVTEVMTTKLDALKEHKSQTSQYDNFLQIVEGLNSYRSIYFAGAKYCETFLKCSQKEYIRLSAYF